MRRFLVTGGTGQLGCALQRLPLPNDVVLVTPKRDELDLCAPDSIAQQVHAGRWHGVLHLAAYTAVDRAEADQAMAWQLNAHALARLAEATAALDIPLVHVSTDYVFSGRLMRPYRETDAVDPLNVYGASKEAGERAIRAGHPRHAIIRTSWLVSSYRQNFLKTMLRLARERDSIKIVADQWGTPTSADDLATALLTVTLRLAEDPAAPTGTFHYANQGAATWAELADAILQGSAALGGPTARVEPIATADYPTRAPRPHDTRLDATAIDEAFGLTRRPWRSAVNDILSETLSGERT